MLGVATMPAVPVAVHRDPGAVLAAPGCSFGEKPPPFCATRDAPLRRLRPVAPVLWNLEFLPPLRVVEARAVADLYVF